jgi:hypothetical protein
MKFVLSAILIMAIGASAAQAQNAGDTGDGGAKPLTITANFQVRIPIDAAAPTTSVTQALAQANQALGDLASRQCDLLSESFKGSCRVVQLNMGANVNDRRIRQFNNDGGDSQRFVNANLNATFEVVMPSETPKNAPVAK